MLWSYLTNKTSIYVKDNSLSKKLGIVQQLHVGTLKIHVSNLLCLQNAELFRCFCCNPSSPLGEIINHWSVRTLPAVPRDPHALPNCVNSTRNNGTGELPVPNNVCRAWPSLLINNGDGLVSHVGLPHSKRGISNVDNSDSCSYYWLRRAPLRRLIRNRFSLELAININLGVPRGSIIRPHFNYL